MTNLANEQTPAEIYKEGYQAGRQIAAINDRFDQADVINTIKQTVAKGATDAELKMFIEVCRATGLNPFLREIWYVASRSDPKTGHVRPGIIMAGRDGYLRVANENPQFDGMETRVDRDEKQVPIKATCIVWRKDRSHAIICEAYFNEYVRQSPVWQQYPSAMISKVAEVLALKRSFAINGVVTEEEIGGSPPPVTMNAAGEITGGSQQAADEMAKNKLATMAQGVQAKEVMDILHDVMVATPPDEPEKPKSKAFLNLMKSFEDILGKFQKLYLEDIYHDHLKAAKVRRADQFTDDEKGFNAARKCFRGMTEALSEVEMEKATK